MLRRHTSGLFDMRDLDFPLVILADTGNNILNAPMKIFGTAVVSQ